MSEKLRFTPSIYNCHRPDRKTVMFTDGKVPMIPTGYDADGEPEDWKPAADGRDYPKTTPKAES